VGLKLHNSYSSPNVISVIKSRRTRWARHGAQVEIKIKAYRDLVREIEGKR
jgi:hypothetical protein